jgi:AraC-like DNA-binding protein
MICQNLLPSPPLQPYVRYYAMLHFVFDEKAEFPFKPYTAKSEHCLAFFPRGLSKVDYVTSKETIERPRSTISGPQLTRTNCHTSRDSMLIQVYFQPGMLFRLTGIPSHELINTHVDAEAVFAKQILLVNERLNSTDDYKQIIEIIEAFLLSRIRKAKLEAHAIDSIGRILLHQPSRFSLDHLADQACLCPSQFERKFIERMGINPKLFARIARFEKAYLMKNTNPHLDWLSIALACGYSDYQHLVKDCKAFAGVTPPVYMGEDSKSPESFFEWKEPKIFPEPVVKS